MLKGAGRVVWRIGSVAASGVVSSFKPFIKILAGAPAVGADIMSAYGVPCPFVAVFC
jgi:hypothetical protein